MKLGIEIVDKTRTVTVCKRMRVLRRSTQNLRRYVFVFDMPDFEVSFPLGFLDRDCLRLTEERCHRSCAIQLCYSCNSYRLKIIFVRLQKPVYLPPTDTFNQKHSFYKKIAKFLSRTVFQTWTIPTTTYVPHE
ncbi:hypothetical protein J6590_016396 [Homalodisca vitripennis]|nr:hypothetical protein J6590_016396 [Homalodisca vitripennis]